MTRDWRETWVDEMGLIVALSSDARFQKLSVFKQKMAKELTVEQQAQLRICLRQRFTPSNGQNGCQGATAAVKGVTQ